MEEPRKQGNPSWKKGKSGNPNGRPLGAINRIYMSPNFWLEIVHQCLEETDPEKKLTVALQIVDKLLLKVNNLPGLPEDSVDNANNKAIMLEALNVSERTETINTDA